jgi:3-oxoadipate enol-lactonase
MPEFKSNEATLFYQVSGDGLPIIFTHGASWNHYQWNSQVEFLKNYYKTAIWISIPALLPFKKTLSTGF